MMSSRRETRPGDSIPRPNLSVVPDAEEAPRAQRPPPGPETTLRAVSSVPVPVRRDLPACLPVERLVGHERWIVPFMRWINTTRFTKDWSYWQLYFTSRIWMRAASGRLWNHRGLEHVAACRPKRGVLLVGNHRSFFDMYVALATLWRYTDLVRHIYFPVRANFFYEGPLGVFVNLSMAAGSMWPPVFRDPERRFELNPTGLEQMAWALDRPGALMGMHPEGTRGKGPDPYAIAPAKRGVGDLVKACHPELTIIPFFVGGMSNDIVHEIRRGFFGSREEKGHGIRYTFGRPRLGADLDMSRDSRELAEEMLDWVRELAEQDRERVAGPLPDAIGVREMDRRAAAWKKRGG